MQPDYKLWQVLLYVVDFLLIMGLVGGEDMKAAQMADRDLLQHAGGRP